MQASGLESTPREVRRPRYIQKPKSKLLVSYQCRFEIRLFIAKKGGHGRLGHVETGSPAASKIHHHSATPPKKMILSIHGSLQAQLRKIRNFFA
jgi:hypothetical protein